MITTLIATAIFGLATQHKLETTCAVTGDTIDKPVATMLYKGAAYDMCCGGCPGAFQKSPEKFLKAENLKDKTVGVFLFDPVSGAAVKADKAAAGPSVYNGVAYFFGSAEDKTAFDADPKKFTTAPDKEALYCPVMKEVVKDEAHSGGYFDADGVRYYICCGDCLATLKADPSKYLANAAKYVTDAKVAKAANKD